jgi:hypothetical protein
MSASNNQALKENEKVNQKKNKISVQGTIENESCSLWRKNNVLSN